MAVTYSHISKHHFFSIFKVSILKLSVNLFLTPSSLPKIIVTINIPLRYFAFFNCSFWENLLFFFPNFLFKNRRAWKNIHQSFILANIINCTQKLSDVLTFNSKILDIWELLSYLFLREKYIAYCSLIAASLKFYFSLYFFQKVKRI